MHPEVKELDVPKHQFSLWALLHPDLRKDLLIGELLSAKTNDETHHCQAAIPCFSGRRESELAIHSFVQM